MLINIYKNWEVILKELSTLYCFNYTLVGNTINSFGKLQDSYEISEICFARKADLDDFIINNPVGSTEYARASVLYSMYACGYLEITDIKYPTYQSWKNQHYGMTLDHKLPRIYFPRLTFDCTNWQEMSRTENYWKGDDFLEEGLERLDFLSSKLQDIKSKYD